VHFAADFVHPDGSFGGVYGSRNTRLFFPHGLELLGPEIPAATWMAERYLHSGRAGTRLFLDDDRLIGHLTYNHLQAFLDYHPQRQASPPADQGTHFWPGAGLYVRRQDALYAVVSVTKGGVVTMFEGDRPLYTDSGLIARQRDGRCLASHLVDSYEYEIRDDAISIQGHFGSVTHRVPTPLTTLIFHLGMVTVGRWCSNVIRALLQKLLIVGKKPALLRFQRTVQFHPQVTVIDEIWDLRRQRDGSQRLTALYAGTDHTSIYVAMSNAYQVSSLLPWTDDTAALETLRTSGYVQIMRPLTRCGAPGAPPGREEA
jgi:hypothetical protein